MMTFLLVVIYAISIFLISFVLAGRTISEGGVRFWILFTLGMVIVSGGALITAIYYSSSLFTLGLLFLAVLMARSGQTIGQKHKSKN